MLFLIAACSGATVTALGWVSRGVHGARRSRRDARAAARSVRVLRRKLAEQHECESEPVIVRDRVSGGLYALAVVGGAGREGSQGVTTVFRWGRGRWRACGREIEGAETEAILRRYRRTLERVA